jgi:hypothetical protein
MAKKVLVPVFPSDRFYEAVVRAADIVAEEGGLVVFAFTKVRPTPDAYSSNGDGRPAELDVELGGGEIDGPDIEAWRVAQISGLEEARQLCYDRGVDDSSIDYLFADEADGEGTAQAIADEAAAGAFDMVVLSRGYFENEVEDPSLGGTPQDVAAAVVELEGPALVVC